MGRVIFDYAWGVGLPLLVLTKVQGSFFSVRIRKRVNIRVN